MMFADIRGFTTFSEKSRPEDVFEALNFYLSAMIPAVLGEHGILDKIIGDEIMVIFGILPGTGNAPEQAVRAALKILFEVKKLNHLRELDDLPRLHVGVGVASGPVALGVLGSRHRKSITVIGNHVNLAARLQGQAGPGQLIVDRDTFNRLGNFQRLFTEREVTLKGYRTPVGVMQLDIEQVIQSQGALPEVEDLVNSGVRP
jgi:class 3 adenylate cyclase